jgi:hypothetical protein
MMNDLTCGDCRHFVEAALSGPRLVGAAREGECRRHPPCPVAVPDRHGVQLLMIYPRLHADYPACGEHDRKPIIESP